MGKVISFGREHRVRVLAEELVRDLGVEDVLALHGCNALGFAENLVAELEGFTLQETIEAEHTELFELIRARQKN